MNSFFTQVSSSIRILGWNRDASARATHLKAAGGNVPSATIERKSMSTKTSIKRIALVAAAALALGGFSAVSASAASTSTIAQVAGTGDNGVGGIAGPANTMQVLITPTSTPAKAYVTVTGGTISSAVSGAVIAVNGGSATLGGADSLTITTPTAGSIVINVYDATSASTFSSTVSVTKTITVLATGVSGTYSAGKSSVYVASGLTATAVTADASVIVASTAAASGDTATTAAATIQVLYNDANGTAITNDSITATITSGGGNINGVADSTTVGLSNALNQYSKSVTSTRGAATFAVWPNGQVGNSVITVKNSNGDTLATKTITFASTVPATVAVTVKKAYVLNSNTETAKVFAITVSDAGNNAITGATVTMAPATGSTVGEAGVCTSYNATDKVYYCSAKASVANTAKTTVDNSETYTFTAGTIKATASVKFVSGDLTTIAIAGPASADPGTKVTYTLTASGANGSPMPDGAYSPGAILTNAAPTTNASLVTIPFTSGETITLANGAGTSFGYAPFSGVLSAAWKIAGTASTAASIQTTLSSGQIASFLNAGLSKAIAATTVTADDVTITGNTEATAAANAATDAANQAADAADNATQAAAEALAAVNTLATTVATLIDGIKNQIKALNTLILAIKKKIKA